MTQEHPITPPPELVEQWRTAPEYTTGMEKLTMVSMTTRRLQEIADQSAQYGADQELEACCEWIYKLMDRGLEWSMDLRTSRRPKPPSLKKQALLQLDTLNADLAMHGMGCDLSQIRRALEQLDD